MGRGGRLIDFEGVFKKISQWGKEYGLDHSRIIWRLNKGWTMKDALTKPLRKMPRRLPQSIRKQKQTNRLNKKKK